MEIKLLHQPDNAIAHVTLDAGEEIIAQAGAMVAMSGNINASTTLRKGKGGGIMGGLKRMLAGESLFLSVFRAPLPNSEIWFAPKLMGISSCTKCGAMNLLSKPLPTLPLAPMWTLISVGKALNPSFQGNLSFGSASVAKGLCW